MRKLVLVITLAGAACLLIDFLAYGGQSSKQTIQAAKFQVQKLSYEVKRLTKISF